MSRPIAAKLAKRTAISGVTADVSAKMACRVWRETPSFCGSLHRQPERGQNLVAQQCTRVRAVADRATGFDAVLRHCR